MKAVLALLIVCLIQISFAEQENVADDASSVANLLLKREVRDAGKGGCEKGDRKCERQKKRKERKKLRKQKKRNKENGGKVKKSQSKSGKKGGKKGRKGKGKKLARKLKGNKTQQQDTIGKQKKKKSNNKKGTKKKSRKDKKVKKVKGSRSSSANGSGRNTTGQCFTDMVAKTKKFNKAQVEFRLAKRIEGFAEKMKNKKNKSASAFIDALEAMNDATENGTSCDGDSSSLAEAKKVQATLANCSASAGDICDEGKLSIPINSTKVSSCKTTLEAFAKDFKECLTKSGDATICSCIQGLTNPSSDCLNFKAMHDGVKAQREKCMKKSTEEGSFGDCRKQERMAVKFGNKCKKSCSGPGSVTTQAPAASQRMKLLQRLNQKLNFF